MTDRTDRDAEGKTPPGEPDAKDPDAPPTEEEVLASQRLRDALEGEPPADARAAEDAAFALALRSAWQAPALADDAHRAIVDATPSKDEMEAAAFLRDALGNDDGREPTGDALLAVALRNAYDPRPLDESAHRAIVDAAIAKLPAKGVSLAPKRSNIVRVAFGAATAGLALAASVVLVLVSQDHGAGAPLARSRTTQPLFAEPFKPGETSARIDRIASARASDFRNNRFARWGVR